MSIEFLRHGRYQIIRQLGEGGQGLAFLADDLISGEQVVLKRAIGDLDNIQDEYDLLALIDHSNVVSVRSVYHEDQFDGMVLVEDVAKGMPLSTFTDGICDDSLISLAAQLMSAISHLHVIGIRHGDIKPSNILVLEQPSGILATLIDFGLSTRLDGDSFVGGTPDFLAPELHRGGQVSAACDWYALGHTLEVVRHAQSSQHPESPHPIERVIRTLKLEDPRSRLESVSWLVDAPGITDSSLLLPSRLPFLNDGPTFDNLRAKVVRALFAETVDVVELGGRSESGRSDCLRMLVKRIPREGIAAVFRADWIDLKDVWCELAVEAGIRLDVASSNFDERMQSDDVDLTADPIAVFLELVSTVRVPALLVLGTRSIESSIGQEILRRCRMLDRTEFGLTLVVAAEIGVENSEFQLRDCGLIEVETLLRSLFPREWKNSPEKGRAIAECIAEMSQGSQQRAQQLVREACRTGLLFRRDGCLDAELSELRSLQLEEGQTPQESLSSTSKQVLECLEQNLGFLDRKQIQTLLSLNDSQVNLALRELSWARLAYGSQALYSPIQLIERANVRAGDLSWDWLHQAAQEGIDSVLHRFGAWLLSSLPEAVSCHVAAILESNGDWFPGRGRIIILGAKSFLKTGNSHRAIDLLNSITAEDQGELGQLTVSLFKTRILAAIGDLELGLDELSSWNVEELDENSRSLIQSEKTYLHLLLGDTESARLEMGASISQGVDGAALGRSLTMMGLVQRATGRLDEARAMFRRAATSWRQLGDHRREAAALGNLALCDLDESKFHRASAVMLEAQRILKDYGYVDQIASVTNNIGVCLSRNRQFLKAARVFGETMRLFASCGDLARLEMARASRGIAFLGAGELAAARSDLYRSLPHLQASGNQAALEKTNEALEVLNLISGRFGRLRSSLSPGASAHELLRDRFKAVHLDRSQTAVGLRSSELLDHLLARISATEIWSQAGRHELAMQHLEALFAWRHRLEKDMNKRERSLFRSGIVFPALERLESRLSSSVSTGGESPLILRVIGEVLNVLNRSGSNSDALDGIVHGALELTKAVRAFVIRMDDEDGQTILAQAFESQPIGESPEVSTLVIQRCMESRKPIVVMDAGSDVEFGFAASVRALGLRSIACFPLLNSKNEFHVLYLDTPLESDAFKQSELNSVKILAELASASLALVQRARDSDEKSELAFTREMQSKRALTQKSNEVERNRQQAGFGILIGDSEPIVRTKRLLKKAGKSELSILITGETGSGKELAAQRIHQESRRSAMPFVALNGAALPESLVETELFGHVKGAFTGATADNRGLLRMAEGGTFFLDECGDLSLAVQSKLLRVLEEKVVRPVGSSETFKIDVRFVFATNRSVKGSSSFREDLYYRISEIEIDMPPLKARPQDLAALTTHFLSRSPNPKLTVEEEALKAMEEYPWPGNVRELRNVVDRLAVLCKSNVALLTDLPQEIIGFRGEEPVSLADAEMKAIRVAMHFCGGEKKAAAKILGISRTALYDKLKRHDENNE